MVIGIHKQERPPNPPTGGFGGLENVGPTAKRPREGQLGPSEGPDQGPL